MDASIDVFTSSLRRSDVGSKDEDIIIGLFNFLFPDGRNLEFALDLIDKNRSTIVTSYRGASSDRQAWSVLGSKGTSYLCLRQFCPCRSFIELNKNSNTSVNFCKHLICIRLLECLGLIEEKVVTDQEFVDMVVKEYTRSDS